MKGTNRMYSTANAEMFHPQTIVGKFLLWLWDLIDISENIRRIEGAIDIIPNGFWSAFNIFVFCCLTGAFGVLAWFFDVQSTIIGFASVTELVVPSLPRQVAHLSEIIIVCLTFLPTFLELFTSWIAKADVKIMQIAIIGFTLFDMITDIPRAYGLALGMWPQIELIVWPLNLIVFYAYFLLVLGFATLGFELLTIMCAYIAFLCVLKTFRGEGSYEIPIRVPSVPRRPKTRTPRASTRTTTDLGGDEDVVIIT